MLNIIDVCIILIIIFEGIVGFKRGVIKQGVITIGTFLVLILSFLLKNPVSLFMYKHLPFFGFDNIIENATVLNIIVYESLAFIICFSILQVILIILIRISSIIEFILKATVILQIPSKILGTILGLIEGYLIVFVLLFVLQSITIPIEKNIIENSKLKEKVLSNNILISKLAKPTLNSFDELKTLIDNKDDYNSDEFNCKAINILIKNDFITKDSLNYLYDNNKIKTKCNF